MKSSKRFSVMVILPCAPLLPAETAVNLFIESAIILVKLINFWLSASNLGALFQKIKCPWV